MFTTSIFGCLAAALSLLNIATAAETVNSVPYRNQVSHIRYKNVVSPGGSYELVTHMDPDTCACDKTVGHFKGNIAPLDEDMSLHFRGPLQLKQVAVYYPAGSAKRSVPPHGHGRVDAEHWFGNDTSAIELEKRGVSGSYQRTAYYNAEQGVAEGLIFMNNRGGQGSGTFDHCWGESLSFMNADCSGGSSKPQVLKDMTIPSNVEFSIFSDQKCNGDCGYTRPGAPAYKGFAGKSKAFLFEFAMPRDGNGGFNGNMPSIWGLNAKIPRTSQYGGCSCWGSGCGEFDFFEILEGDKSRCKTHFHADPQTQAGGGSPDYFARPTSKPIKAAAIFDASGEVHVKLLKEDVQFGSSLPTSILGLNDGDESVYNVPSVGK